MKWAIREAIDVYFKAKSVFKLGARTIRAGEPVLILDTVKTSTFEVAAEVSYVTGGRGNSRILSYEGDKVLTFSFEDALLSAEGLAILSGADLIPARNRHLPGSSPTARSVISHYTEKYAVTTNNTIDLYTGTGTAPTDGADPDNTFPDDPALYPGAGPVTGLRYPPRGGMENVWLSKKPYVGQNADIYVMLLDINGEVSGSPLQINLANNAPTEQDIQTQIAAYPGTSTNAGQIRAWATASLPANKRSYLAKFASGYKFIAFDRNNQPMPVRAATGNPLPSNAIMYPDPTSAYENGTFDDKVRYYVDIVNLIADKTLLVPTVEPTQTTYTANDNWVTSWGDINAYVRQISAPNYGNGFDDFGPSYAAAQPDGGAYAYLLAPSGAVAQPVAFKEGTQYVYKVNVPSILYQDITLLDYYVENQHDATQVSILPDKFGPYLYVEGSSLVRRASDGIDLPVEFVIPKFKVTTALSFTLQSTGDASTFTFSGDAYPDFSKFDLTRRVLADIQILNADDNYDGSEGDSVAADPTSYRRFQYNEDTDGSYLWADPSIEPHSNLDYSDSYDYNEANANATYKANVGGAETRTPGAGVIDTIDS